MRPLLPPRRFGFILWTLLQQILQQTLLHHLVTAFLLRVTAPVILIHISIYIKIIMLRIVSNQRHI